MAKAKKTRKSSGGRGSPEAIEKRRTARQLNTLLMGGPKKGAKLDGRTEKRRRRLIKELKGGRSGKELKPIDVVTHVNELMEIGETLASLKKQGVKPRKTDTSPEIMDTVSRTQKAYGFRPEAWKMLGIDLTAASAPKKRGPSKAAKSGKSPRKTSRKRKAR